MRLPFLPRAAPAPRRKRGLLLGSNVASFCAGALAVSLLPQLASALLLPVALGIGAGIWLAVRGRGSP